MSRTAYQEHYGESQSATIGADYRIRATRGPGGCRIYAITATTTGLKVTLPDARRLKLMGDACYTIANRGANTFTVRDADDNLVTTVTTGDACDLFLIDNTTDHGTWAVLDYAMGGNSAILMDRQVVRLAYGNENRSNVNLLDDAIAAGFDITVPSALQVYVVDEAIVGSTTTARAAMESGSWPAGTTLRLYVGSGARICGIGGRGGNGGSASGSILAQNGSDGGPALDIEMDTALLNYGKIQGGGGGGGGRSGGGGTPGGGGGGGAGHKAALGGTGGIQANGQPFTAGNGRQGTVDAPGAGGINIALQFAGSGGAAGTAGSAPSSGGLGGAAGYSIRKATGITLTKLVAGTIDGSEVSV